MNLNVSNMISGYFSEEEITSLLGKLVSIPSHDGIENQETEVAKCICDFFEKEGIESVLIPVVDGRCNVTATLSGAGGGKSLLFTGHTDTVPPYDMEEPYNPKIVDGNMYGRGVLDMKAGLVCMMVAMAAIKRAGIILKGDLIFGALIDEEAKSLGTRAWLRSCKEFPDAAIVSEPSNMEICAGHRGLEWFEFTFHGKTVHGGRQSEGINAIQKAAMFINRIERDLVPKVEKKEIHPIIGGPSMNYGLIKGGTQPSTVAGECILQMDRRWIPGESFDQVTEEYRSIIEQLKEEDPKFDADMKVMEISYMDDYYVHEAMDTHIGEPIVKAAEKAIEEITAKKAEIRSFPAWSDGGLLNYYGKIPTIVLGPGELEYAHSANEHIPVSALVPAVMIYASIAMDFCN